jgi:RNA polymerase sigma-70 factor (ECF subfamily)
MVPPLSGDLLPAAPAHERVGALYSAARDGVFRYLLALGLDAARAQEVTQDAFLRLHVALLDGAAIEDPKAWVYRVAHNGALDGLDRMGREEPYSDAIAGTLAGFDKSPEQELIEKEWLEGFQNAMQDLSRQQRLCLELRAQGLQYRQIAEILQVRTSTVGEFLRRGIKQLRRWNQCRK